MRPTDGGRAASPPPLRERFLAPSEQEQHPGALVRQPQQGVQEDMDQVAFDLCPRVTGGLGGPT